MLRQSCAKAGKVIVYAYGGRPAEVWWDKVKGSTTRFDNLTVLGLSEAETTALAGLASRAMKMQVNIQDGEVMVSADEGMVYVTPGVWKGSEGGPVLLRLLTQTLPSQKRVHQLELT